MRVEGLRIHDLCGPEYGEFWHARGLKVSRTTRNSRQSKLNGGYLLVCFFLLLLLHVVLLCFGFACVSVGRYVYGILYGYLALLSQNMLATPIPGMRNLPRDIG